MTKGGQPKRGGVAAGGIDVAGRGGRGQARAGSTSSTRGRGTSRKIFDAEGGSQAGGSQAGGSQAGESVREDGGDSVFSQEVMETTPVRPIPPGPGESVRVDRERAKRTVEERSPEQEVLRNTRLRLNEFDAGYIFEEVENRLVKTLEEVVAAVPDPLKDAMRHSMEALRVAISGVMSGLSEGIKQERMAKEAMEMRLEDKIVRMDEKVKELNSATDSLTKTRIKTRTKESVREMESKVRVAQCALKLLDVDIERVTDDRREIVRRTITKVRSFCSEDDKRAYDFIMRRTRVVILGKSTSRRMRDQEEEFSVPTLFQCRDRRDTEDLEGILRTAGYFPSFHWPREMMEFVGGVRTVVTQQGVDDRANYIRVRPEVREGNLMVKVEVKPKVGMGRFSLKGLWQIPPLNRVLWDDVPDLYVSKIGG